MTCDDVKKVEMKTKAKGTMGIRGPYDCYFGGSDLGFGSVSGADLMSRVRIIR